MARKLRIQYEGAIYHVMSRGNGKAAVFHNDVDRRSFVQTLAEACAKTDWQVHAYCLMKTHFHLVLETPRPNLVPGMKWLLGTYTSALIAGIRLSGIFSAGATRHSRWMAVAMDTCGRPAITCI